MSWTRRRFTFSLGASLLCAPFIDLISAPGRARAEPAGKPTRLIVFFTPNGTVHNRLWPQGGETDFQFAAGSILEPLTPHRKELIVLSGIDFIGVNNHEAGMANMLTGGGPISVDQHIAAEIGKGARFPSLEFGVQTSAWGGNVQTRMCYKGGQPVAPEDNPLGLYKRLFGAAAGGQAEAERLLRRKKSILDHLRAELSDLSGQLGKAEQAKLESHLEAVRALERNLNAPQRCDAPMAPVERGREAIYSHGNFPAIGKEQMDLMLLGLRCGLTQVASIQWGHTVGPTVFSWIGEGQGHHELSHQKNQSFVNCERWFASKFADLLAALKATPDPQGGTLLDTTLVVWAKELGDGSLHTCASVPFVLAGGAGYFRTGRYLQYRGAPHQQLLTSICQAMGLQTESFGDRSRGSGALPGLR